LLSAAERARAEAFKFERDRRRFQAAHILLRKQLGRYLEESPASLRLEVGPFGKPYVPDASWLFNLSHSGSYYAAAFTQAGEVGIDIETGASLESPRELVSEVCHPAEVALLEGSDVVNEREAFLCLWAAKEAFLKALGCGLQVSPRDIWLRGPLRPGPVEFDACVSGVQPQDWELHLLEVHPEWVAAVAVPRGSLVVVRESLFDA
jgi:4'-phosphopantetheinyl transferase